MPTLSTRYVLLTALLVSATAAGAQPVEAPPLTLEALFASPTYAPKYFEGGRWADEGPVLRYVDSDADAGTTSLVELNLETDDRRTLIDGAALRNPDATGEDDALIQIEDYAYSPDGAKVLLYTDSERVWRLNTKGYYYVYDLPTGRVSAIAPRADGFQMFAKFDPAGRRVAFVRDRDLWVTDVTTGAVRRLTDTGSEGGIINGTFDWVYEEEFGLRDGFRWSPDGEHIAFFQLDETATRDFQVTNYTTLYPEYQTFRYPKVGEMNSEVRIGLVDPQTGAIRYFETDTWYDGPEEGRSAPEHTYDDETEYIAGMGWTPPIDGQPMVWMIRMNRDQDVAELLYGDPRTMEVRTILREESDAYVEVETGFSDVATGTVTFLRDGEHFVLRSDRDGNSHLYLYTLEGRPVDRITRGNWDVSDFHGVDEETGWVYFTSNAAGARERHLYRTRLPGTRRYRAGAEPERITQEPGWHGSELSGDFRYVLDVYSTQMMPPVTQLLRSDGTPVTVLQDNQELRARVAALGLPTPEFMDIPGADGTPLHAYMIRPTDFDPGRRYPVLFHIYGGPGSQEVADRWGGSERLWHHMLAENLDMIVVGVDNRGTGGRGHAFKTITQRRLGVLEAEDQIAAAQWLARQPYVDGDRIGIWGWSYGGYLSLLAMMYGEGPETFHAGIAVAPVSNWRYYDTIYTERFLGTPQENAAGYDEGSPVTYADRMSEDQRLLLVHGDADDNVHVQNTIVMANALQAAGRQFEMMIYPGRNHGIYGGRTRLHLFTLLTNFLEENLASEEAVQVGTR